MPPTRRHLWALHEAPKVIVGPQPIYEHTTLGEPLALAWIGARGSHGQPAKREPDRLVAMGA